jgi:molybdopterin-guanine dinucleotide biosynthesis protein A
VSDEFAPVVRENTLGILLAGGRGSRMGGHDKGLVQLAGRSLAEHALRILRPQVSQVAISANRNRQLYARFGCVVVSDRIEDFAGPLAGIQAVMTQVESPWYLVLPCDMPFLPDDLRERLAGVLQNRSAWVACAADGTRIHPTIALLSRSVLVPLTHYLAAGGRKVSSFYESLGLAMAEWNGQAAAFRNFNRSVELIDEERSLDSNVTP